jgi:hypothetical protein
MILDATIYRLQGAYGLFLRLLSALDESIEQQHDSREAVSLERNRIGIWSDQQHLKRHRGPANILAHRSDEHDQSCTTGTRRNFAW